MYKDKFAVSFCWFVAYLCAASLDVASTLSALANPGVVELNPYLPKVSLRSLVYLHSFQLAVGLLMFAAGLFIYSDPRSDTIHKALGVGLVSIPTSICFSVLAASANNWHIYFGGSGFSSVVVSMMHAKAGNEAEALLSAFLIIRFIIMLMFILPSVIISRFVLKKLSPIEGGASKIYNACAIAFLICALAFLLFTISSSNF